MLRILIADDHPIFRKGLMEIISAQLSDCEVTDVADGAEALPLLLTNRYEIAILDVDMPNMDGLEVCKALKEETLITRIIILTMFKEEAIFNRAMALGASGFLLKDHSGTEILKCIDRVRQGKQHIGKGLEDRIENHKDFLTRKKRIEQHLSYLTESELKTLKLVGQKNTTKEIASKLFVTPKSVENYRSRICKKLSLAPGNNSLVKWVLEHKELLASL
jgi:DNA-binding NarL/FixJ family response regulator